MAERNEHLFDDAELAKLMRTLTFWRVVIRNSLLENAEMCGQRGEEMNDQAYDAQNCQHEIDEILASMFFNHQMSIPQESYEIIQRHMEVIEDCVEVLVACHKKDKANEPLTVKYSEEDDLPSEEGEEWKTQ